MGGVADGFHRGVVVDVADPDGRKRIRATVPSVLGNTPSVWAMPLLPVTSPVPAVGDGVWMCFEGGDESHPLWLGAWNPAPVILGSGGGGSSTGDLLELILELDDIIEGLVDVYEPLGRVDQHEATRVHYRHVGDWIPGYAYNNEDVITWNGGLWRCTDAHTSVGEEPDPNKFVYMGGSPVAAPLRLGSLRLVGHSYIDTGTITEGGTGRRSFSGRLADALGVPANHVERQARVGSSARFANYLAFESSPGNKAWPFPPNTGLGVVWWGGNDAREAVVEDGWEEYSYKAAMQAVIARIRQGSVRENTDPTVTYSGTWTTNTTIAGSGASLAQTTVPASKAVITTPNDMGRGVDGVWVDIGMVAGDAGAQAEVWLDGVKHGDVDLGLGADKGTAFEHGDPYYTCVVYRMWIPTTYTGTNVTTVHTIELRHKENVNGSTTGLLFDYWAIESNEGPAVLCLNQPIPANPTAIENLTPLGTAMLNEWLKEVVDGFVIGGTSAKDPLVRYVDIHSLFDPVGWSDWSNARFYLTDGLHPNEFGGKVAAEAVLAELRQMFTEGVDMRAVLGVRQDQLDPLLDPPRWFIGDGAPPEIHDRFDRAPSEFTLGGDWDETVGAWGVDEFEQIYCVDEAFPHYDVRDTFKRAGSIGTVEGDRNGTLRAWTAHSGSWLADNGAIGLSAEPVGNAVATVQLNSTTQTVTCYSSSLINNYGIVLRYVDTDNYLFMIVNTSWGRYDLWKRVGGAETFIGSVTPSPTTGYERYHAEIGADNIVRVWNAYDGKYAGAFSAVGDAVLQSGGSGTRAGMFVHDAVTTIGNRFQEFTAGTTLSSEYVASAVPFSTVVHDFSLADGAIEIELGTTVDSLYAQTQGTGIVFRYVDSRNYLVFYSTLFGIWALQKVVDGVAFGPELDTGTATAGGSNTLTDSGASWTVDEWEDKQLRIVSGTGAGQTRFIDSNTSTVLTVTTNWTTNPDATSVYIIEDPAWLVYLGYGAGNRVGLEFEGTSVRAFWNGVQKNWNTPTFGASEVTVTEHSTGTSHGFAAPFYPFAAAANISRFRSFAFGEAILEGAPAVRGDVLAVVDDPAQVDLYAPYDAETGWPSPLQLATTAAVDALEATVLNPGTATDGTGVVLLAGQTVEPATPAADKMVLYAEKIAGRIAASMLADTGESRLLGSPPWARSWIHVATQSSVSIRTTGTGSVPSTAGTYSTVNAATTLGPITNIVSSAGAGANAYLYNTNPLVVFRGAGTDVYAGFFMYCRARFPDASYNNTGASTGTRIWVLGSYGTSVGTLMGTARGGTQDICGFNREHVNGANTDTNWKFVTGDNTASTVGDTGMAFTTGDLMDFWVWCPAGSGEIFWQIDNVTLGTTVAGSATGNLPRTTIGLSTITGVQTVDAVARNLQFRHFFIESDKG